MRAVLMVGAVMLAATGASAGNQNDAGCGVGSLLFKENKKADQILAATTNSTFGNQTFGITTGTANCGESARAASLKQENYVAANYRNLSREMAAGQGEYVSSLATLLGCERSAFGRLAQSRYETLFPKESLTPGAFLATLKGEIAKDSNLSRTCSAL